MPQIDIRLSSTADDSGFRRIAAAGQNLESGFKRIERGLDQMFRAFRPEAIVQSFLGGAGIGTAFAVIDRAFEKATEGSRKLAESIENLKKAEADLAAVRTRIERASRTPQENLSDDRLTLQGVEQRIAELEGLRRTITTQVEIMRRGPNGDMVGTGRFRTESRTLELSAAQNNELAAMKKKQADLVAEIAKNEEAVSREQERQIAASNAKVEQFNTQKDEAAAKRLLAVNERLGKIGDEQIAAEFAKLTPAQQISELLEEDARLKAESAALDLNNVAHLERIADLESRRLVIARALEVSYRNAAAEVDRMLAKQLGAFGREKAAIEADPRATDFEKRRKLIPILEKERELLAARVAALEQEVALTTDPLAQRALEDRLEKTRAMQAANAGDMQRANPASRLEQAQDSRRDLSDPSKHYQTVGEGALGGAMNFLTQLGTMADQVAAGIENTLGAAVNGITQGIMGWINGTMTFRQALANIGQSVLQTILQTLVQMGVRMLLNAALSRVLTSAAAATAIGIATPTAGALSAIWAGPATLATIATLGGAAAQAPASVLAAKGLIFAQSIAGFADGGVVRGPGTGTSDSILARLSNGESVLTARTTGFLGEDFINQLNADPVNALTRPTETRSGPNAQGSSRRSDSFNEQAPRNVYILLNEREFARRMQENSEDWFIKMTESWERRRPFPSY
jgi:hypothetical protein